MSGQAQDTEAAQEDRALGKPRKRGAGEGMRQDLQGVGGNEEGAPGKTQKWESKKDMPAGRRMNEAEEKEGAELQIREAGEDEFDDVLSLAWRVFLKFEAPDYEQEGIANFCDFLTDPLLRTMFMNGEYRILVALEKGELVGMISLRGGNLISLLFVEERAQRRGIGKRLIRELSGIVLSQRGKFRSLRVYAAPFALEFYRRLGFEAITPEIRKAGIRYTEMELKLVQG